MNLQKRIFRLNMLMMVLSLLAMLGVSIYVVNSIYRNQENWQTTSQKTAKVQESIENLSEPNFEQLANELAIYGAQLYVESNGWIEYSNLQIDARELLYVTISATTHTSYLENGIVISRKMAASGQIYYLYALLEDLDDLHESEEFQHFLFQLFAVGGTGIVLVVFLNLVFTRRILAVITRPLDELHHGVERIRIGDYSVSLDYQGDREFEELTQGFNQMQEALVAAYEKNQAYEQNRTRMVADISHDLRTPLTSIKGYAKGILDGIAHTEEKRTHYLSVIYQKAMLMENLLEKLFVFSKLETDRLPFDMVETNLTTFLQDYVKEKQLELADQAVSFQLDLDEDLPTELDRIQFRRILDNLVDNARKYANVQSLLLTICGRLEEETILWTFADNGQGVAEESLSALFDEFYRVDETRQQVEGHGLGLPIIQNIVNRLGGSVTVENAGGLRFTFRLPRKERQ